MLRCNIINRLKVFTSVGVISVVLHHKILHWEVRGHVLRCCYVGLAQIRLIRSRRLLIYLYCGRLCMSHYHVFWRWLLRNRFWLSDYNLWLWLHHDIRLWLRNLGTLAGYCVNRIIEVQLIETLEVNC